MRKPRMTKLGQCVRSEGTQPYTPGIMYPSGCRFPAPSFISATTAGETAALKGFRVKTTTAAAGAAKPKLAGLLPKPVPAAIGGTIDLFRTR